MPVLTLFIGFAASLGAALVLVPVARHLGRRADLVDHADGVRKTHDGSVPYVGGLAVVAAVCVGIATMAGLRWMGLAPLPDVLLPNPLVLIGGVLIACVGVWDDRRDLHPEAKLAAQLWVTALAFKGGVRVDVFDAALGGGIPALLVSVLLTGVWMVGLMNAVNLIDGLDGLAAGVVAIALAGLAGAFTVQCDVGSLVLAVAVVAALVGFLRFNRAPASVFLGDGGSLFLGYVLGAYALSGSAHPDPILSLVVPVVAMGIPVLDTALALLRRALAGTLLFDPDREHLHHRLEARTSARRAVWTLYGVGAALAVGSVAMATQPVGLAWLIFAVLAVGLGTFLVRIGALPPVAATHRQPGAGEANEDGASG